MTASNHNQLIASSESARQNIGNSTIKTPHTCINVPDLRSVLQCTLSASSPQYYYIHYYLKTAVIIYVVTKETDKHALFATKLTASITVTQYSQIKNCAIKMTPLGAKFHQNL